MALAALTSVVWGLGFVAIKFGLESFSAPQLAAARFLIACLPVLWVPRPRLSWAAILLIGMTLFTGQFLLLFFAFAQGMPPGLASVSQQMQAFFTVLLAAVFLRDVPTRRQGLGMVIAFAGLVLIGSTVGGDLKLTALGLALASAFSWAVGNVLVKRTSSVPVFPLVVWASLVPPLPALLVSGLADQGRPSSRRSSAPRGSASRERSTWAPWPPCWPTRRGALSSGDTRPPWWRRSRSSRRVPASSRRR